MLIIGVSGQTGAGKSTLARFLSENGLGKNLEVDAVGHDLLRDQATAARLVKAFGEEILDEEGFICRKALGRRAFAGADSIERLNSIMHPAMIDAVKDEIAAAGQRGDKFLIVNAALLFSMGLDRLCDRIIYVVTSAQIRLKRLVDNRNWSEESAKERLFAQDELPEGRTDIIVVNNDKTEKELAETACRLALQLKGTD